MKELKSTTRAAQFQLGAVAAALLWLAPASVWAAGPLDGDGRLVNFQRDIAPIFRKHCLECHNEKEAKADFRIDDPDSVFSYVEAGDLESSTMYTDYLLAEDPDYMMPPKGHLPAAELSLIRVWIEEGADWPDDASVAVEESDEERAVVADEEPEAPTALVDRVWAFQGFFHPATVHFPIALFLFGAFFVVLGFVWKSLGDQIPLACLLLGAPSAVVASAMGFAFADEQGYGSWTKVNMDSEIFWHRWSGVIVAVVASILAVTALWAIKSGSDRLKGTWKVGLLITAAMVGLVGHQGGELHYGEEFYQKAFDTLLGSSDAVAEADQTNPVEEADSSESTEESDATDAEPVARSGDPTELQAADG
ncbi:MAG: c-type cytochrome domain-containing protein [Planctomycetota bacterium]